MAKSVYGVESIEIAPIGTGAETGLMPSTGYVDIVDIQVGSVSFNIPEPTTNDIRTEDSEGVRWTLKGDSDPPTFNFGTHDLTLEQLVEIFGGTIDAGPPEQYHAAVNADLVQKAVRMTSKPLGGFQAIFEFPLCTLISSFDATFTRDTVSAITVAARVNSPLNQAGEPSPAWGVRYVAVA